MTDPRLQAFLDRNERTLASYQAPPLIADILKKKEPNSGSVYIISCSDFRVDPTRFFGLELGEAHVIRNAGGRAAEAQRSLEVMGSIAPIDLVVVVHHTDCGGLFTTDEEVRSKLSNRAPDYASSIKDKWFGTFKTIGLDESIRQDVEEIKKWPFLGTRVQVIGYALDIDTGAVRQRNWCGRLDLARSRQI
ncbi:hypothetical protein LCI18_005638 [Fusarium solani-melongenae]|uniref:Uncharacterized protein n=1 Tax=Fusarium solani subsp. cucurbitae TaxID=2747967 RepID=A0ACD3Z0D2_FUSSC|nr:hypothetical protein LCI18_005638 [Fusarium solani-melongenae]